MKKQYALFLTLVLLFSGIINAQIGIGTIAPDPSAILELNSNNKGFLLPRMTSDEQANLTNPAKGLTVFNTTTNQIENNIGDGLNSIIWVGASIKGTTAPLGTNTTQLATTEFVQANTGKYTFLEAVGEVTTAAITDEVISGMAVTPPAGTYLVSFNSQYNNSKIKTSTSTANTAFMTDLVAVYDQLNAIVTPAISHISSFGTETLIPGVYTLNQDTTVTGILTLNGMGDPDSIFIIKCTGSLTLAANLQIRLINNATAANVFWLATQAISIGAGGVAKGTFISNGSAVSVGDGTSLEGRLFTKIGAIAFGPGVALIPEANVLIRFGSLATFVMFTNYGAINNIGFSTITGDILSNDGTTSSLSTATIYGTIFDPLAGIVVVSENTNRLLAKVTFSIFQNGNPLANSIRNLTSNGNATSVSLQSLATVNGNQSIDIRWKSDLTNLTLGNRTLSLIKVH